MGILRGQQELGWDTSHLTTPKHEAKALVEQVDGWTFHRTLRNSSGHSGSSVLDPFVVVRLTQKRLEQVIAEEVRPDLIHAHSPVLNAMAANAIGRRLGIPVVYEVRALWEDAAVDHGTARTWGPRYAASRMLETRATKQAQALVTICNGLRDEFLSRGIRDDKITVVPNAVDTDRLLPGRERDLDLATRLGLEDKMVLGFAGSFYRYEGLDILLNALPKVLNRRADLKLILVGGGAEDARLRKLTTKLGLDSVVHFTGWIPHTEIASYYTLVDALIYPRRSIRLTNLVTPLKPLEAMAQGKLVIASDIGGHREMINDNETGYLFGPDNPDHLAARLLEVLENHADWSRITERARCYVETERNWSSVVQAYRQAYDTALSADRNNR